MKSYYMNKWTAILITMMLTGACNRSFDAPPVNADPEIETTLSIQDLKARYNQIGDFKRIEDEQIISGVVIADDRSGNFYKQIVIQDETGGIPVLLDANNVYTRYPVGRRVFIKLKGMMLGDYGGTIQLGIDSSRSNDGRYLNLEGIPQALFDDYIIKGSFNNVVAPKVIKPSDFIGGMNDPLISTLIQMNNTEFKDADITKTYADPSTNVSAVNFTITTCEKQNIVLRNSSYARFAAINVPDGNGSITAVPSIFNGTMQLFIRDTADVQMYNVRCSGQIPTPVLKTIDELKAYAVGDSSIPVGVYIKGIVVSDAGNEASGNYRLQDATAGIQLRFTTAANPNALVNDSLMVTLGGLKLSTFNGGLQVSNVSTVTKSGAGSITPRPATIAEMKANSRDWESTVVTLSNVTIAVESSSSTGVNYSISDATGQLSSFVRNTSSIVMPAAAEAITGYVSIFQSAGSTVPEVQITLRNTSDIEGGTGGSFTAVYDFSSVTNSSGTTDPGDPPVVDGLMFSPFVANGVGANSSAGGRFSFNNWALGAQQGSDDFTGMVNLSKYYEVTITPSTEKKLDISKISFTLQRSGTGVRQLVLRSSIDGFTSNLPAKIEPANSNLSVMPDNIFQIADAVTTAQEGCVTILDTGFTEITSPITIRFYGFNAESTGGTFSIDNVRIEGLVK